MRQASATSSSGVDTKLRQPDIEPQSSDCQEAARAGASCDVDLPLRSSRAHDMGAGQARLIHELPALLSSRLPDLSHTQGHAVPDAARIPEVALPPVLDGFRALLSRSWSPETAYPDTVTPSKWIAGDPSGQCGVSSVWLAKMLAHKYSIRSTFCRGSLMFEGKAEDVGDHCWLEIQGESGEELILDLTSDQAEGFNRQIVFDSKARLDREQVHYIISRKRVEISDLPYSNPIWLRYQRLLLNMIMAMLAANEPGSR